ncbi:hypothetical protein DW261_14540 [Fusobacterium varium]|uniref:hypothetical protein n=1 Tax=Fusobacterium varium TaxID=856 RepID=UPI000E467958|nr:hypothetical protein [Fusobacterium varium]RHG32109.1 hypothetical protein DW261_14540 [Fusobacterium varium]
MNIKSLVNLKIDKESYILIWSIIIILIGVFIYNIENILPEKYFYDSYSIIEAIKLQDYSHFDTSYRVTAKVFSIFNFNELRSYNVILYLIFLTFFIPYLYKNYSLKVHLLFFNIVFLFLASIYLIRPGKEMLQLFIIILCYQFDKLSPIFLIIGGILFRPYLIIQGIIFIGLKFYLKRKNKILWGILILILIVIFGLKFPKIVNLVLGIRKRVNLYRLESPDARTIISDWLDKDGMIFLYINYFINTLRLLFPVELLVKGIKYFPYIVFQIWFTKKLWNWKSVKNNKVILLYSFISISGVFEPDFGSFLRHTVPYFIIIQNILFNESLRGK